MICDNASNNETTVTQLTRLIPDFLGPKGRIRCFAHTINLIAKAIIRLFESEKHANENSEEVAEEENTDVEEDEDRAEEDGDKGETGEEDEETEEDEEEDDWEDGLSKNRADECLDNVSAMKADVEPLRLVLVKVSNMILSIGK